MREAMEDGDDGVDDSPILVMQSRTSPMKSRSKSPRSWLVSAIGRDYIEGAKNIEAVRKAHGTDADEFRPEA